MKSKKIVMSGKQFAGKDTLALMLLEELKDFKRIGIGDSIKIEFAKLKNTTVEEVEANKSHYRPEIIILANEGRAKDPDYWLKKVVEREDNIIVPDMRMKHEYNIFKQNDAVLIRVEADREQRVKRGILVKEDDATETNLDDVKDWNFIIENNEDLEQLRLKAKKLAYEIIQKPTL